MRRRRSKRGPGVERQLDDLVEFGGKRYFAVDFTEGGAPIGLRHDEKQQAPDEELRTPGWSRALRVLQQATARPDGTHRAIGRVRKIGRGLSREIHGASVDYDGEDLPCAVLLPNGNADLGLPARTQREARLLGFLADAALPLRVPRVLAVVPTPAGPVLVREFLRGVPVDLREGRMPAVCPWQFVAEAAAAVHGTDTESLRWLGHATRRQHALAELAEIGAPSPRADAAVLAAFAWLRDHLPPDEPSVLLHGDLLGQNLIVWPDEPLGLIDWEYATRGDPAYDLAIVTRGVRRPFQASGGFEKLLDAYNERAARPVLAREVRFHELCLVLRWHRDEPQRTVRQGYEQQLRRLLDRAHRD
jgi:aminoglycoside phosphotransferase (APT) family kinase protein